MGCSLRVLVGIIIVITFIVLINIYPKEQGVILTFIMIVMFLCAAYELLEKTAITDKSSKAIAQLQNTPYVRLLSDYETTALKKMACTPTDKRVFRITGKVKIKKIQTRGASLSHYTYFNDMKVNVFSEPYARQYIKYDETNIAHVIVDNNELTLLTMNHHHLL